MSQEKNIKETLNSTIHDVVLQSIDPEAIKEIVTNQMKDAVKDVAQDIYGKWGSEFKETLKQVIMEECKINLKQLKIPDFNTLALDVIKAEFQAYEHENKEQIIKDALETIKTLTREDEQVSLKEIQDTFAEYLVIEFDDELFEDIECPFNEEIEKPSSYEALREYLDDRDLDFELNTVLNQREWGSVGTYYDTNIIMTLTKGSEIVAHVNFNVRRERDTENNESYNEYDLFKDKDYKNIYRTRGIEFNQKPIFKEGHYLALSKLNGFEKFVASIEMNKIKIDANVNAELEIETE